MKKDEVIEYLRLNYPDSNNVDICMHVGKTLSAVRTISTRNGIHKSKEYLQKQHIELMKAKEEKYLESIIPVELSQIEQNIIVGSILGDGSLTFSQRSRNAYYREHYSLKQKEYREWKLNQIKSLQFRIEKDVHLKSPSHPIFTDLYNKFYINGVKAITKENIKLFNHPIGLACLYLDDGTLMIGATKEKYVIRVSPCVGITTLCFSREECEILITHIEQQFGIEFRLAQHPDGKGYNIKITKLQHIHNFFGLINPYCKDIQCVKYKYDFISRLEQKRQELIKIYKNSYDIKIASLDNIQNFYSVDNEQVIISMKSEGFKDKLIADALGRNYWGIVDKIRRLRKEGRL